MNNKTSQNFIIKYLEVLGFYFDIIFGYVFFKGEFNGSWLLKVIFNTFQQF